MYHIQPIYVILAYEPTGALDLQQASNGELVPHYVDCIRNNRTSTLYDTLADLV